jgi:hypothetical protein
MYSFFVGLVNLCTDLLPTPAGAEPSDLLSPTKRNSVLIKKCLGNTFGANFFGVAF